MFRKNRAAVLALVATLATGAGAQTALTADSAVELALRNNLSLQRTKISTDAKKRASDRAWNALIPTVTASGSVARQNEATVGNPEWTPGYSVGATLKLSPSVVAAIEQARLEYESGALTYEQARRSLELAVRKAFNQLLLFSAQVDTAARTIETARSQYEQTAAKAKVGQASQLEVLSAQVDWEKLKPTLESAKVAYEGALDSFKATLGLAADQEVTLTGTLEPEAATPQLLTATRAGENAGIVTLRKNLEVTEASKKATRDAALLPYLSLSYSKSPTYSNDQWSDKGSFSVSLGLRLDSFLPWSTTAESLNQFDDTIATLSNEITQQQRDSDTTLRQLRRSIEKSLASLQALKLAEQLAEKNYTMSEEAYRKGTLDLQSLKRAGDSLEAARLNVLEENYNLSGAILDLENELNLPFGSIEGQ